MKIQVAGPGCTNCKTTEQRVVNACAVLDVAAEISHVSDYNEMAKLGVLRTPAVVIDGEIVVMGRVPTVAELKGLISARAVRPAKNLEVFDPAMCCSTGVCGPSVDPALVQFASDFLWVAGQGVHVERYNLAQQPQAFAANETVKAALAQHGNECLPLILLNGAVVSKGRYPSREELAQLIGLDPPASPGPQLPVVQGRCCG
jgi:small redox-active disulfide protein 2